MFKSLLLKEDGDGASRTSPGKEFQRNGARFEKDTRPARLTYRPCFPPPWRPETGNIFGGALSGKFHPQCTINTMMKFHPSTLLVSVLELTFDTAWYQKKSPSHPQALPSLVILFPWIHSRSVREAVASSATTNTPCNERKYEWFHQSCVLGLSHYYRAALSVKAPTTLSLNLIRLILLFVSRLFFSQVIHIHNYLNSDTKKMNLQKCFLNFYLFLCVKQTTQSEVLS